MKKLLLTGFLILVLAGFACGQALAYTQTFNDTTYVKQITTNNWTDILGGSHYNIFSTSVTWNGDDVIIQIKTNNNGTPAYTYDKIADVAIDFGSNGTWDTGIVLKNHTEGATNFTAGEVYSNLANTNWNYSTAYNINNDVADKYDTTNTPAGPHVGADIPVLLNSGSSAFAGNVAWSGSGPYDITITLNNINTTGDWNTFKFLWGSETCGNDTQSNNFAVPLPGAVLLLGAGMARLGAYARRRRVI